MENPILRVLVPDMTMDGSVWDWDNTEVGDVTREKTEGFRHLELSRAATVVRHPAINIHILMCKWMTLDEPRTAARFLVEGGQW